VCVYSCSNGSRGNISITKSTHWKRRFAGKMQVSAGDRRAICKSRTTPKQVDKSGPVDKAVSAVLMDHAHALFILISSCAANKRNAAHNKNTHAAAFDS